MVIIKSLSLKKEKQAQWLLQDVSCTLMSGRITSFIGPSGAGKTTLLRAIVGLTPTQSGTIVLDNQSIEAMSNDERAQKIGFVFQAFNLFPHMTVLENCIDALLIRGIASEQAKKEACTLLEKMGMLYHLQKYPCELSGGQKQRVALVRMLLLKPSVILLDEPTASLDPANSAILREILKQCASEGLTIGLSTQDMDFARKCIDRIYYLENGMICEWYDAKKTKRITVQEQPRLKAFLNL